MLNWQVQRSLAKVSTSCLTDQYKETSMRHRPIILSFLILAVFATQSGKHGYAQANEASEASKVAHYSQMVFDNNGVNRKSLKFLDSKGAPVMHKSRGYHSVQTQYDQYGNPLSISYKDESGRPVNRRDNCVANIIYAYDNKHRRISTKLFNAENEATKFCDGNWHETKFYYYQDGPLSHTKQI